MKALNVIITAALSTAATWFATKALYKNPEKEMEESYMKVSSKFISELREKVLNLRDDLSIEKVKHLQTTSALKTENDSLKEEIERLRKVLKATQRKAYELASKEVNNA